jgi:hypothetical protein
MLFRLVRPVRRSNSSMSEFVQRIPKDVRAQAVGLSLDVPLGYVDGDSVRRAYSRAEFWDERVKMMTWWANRCDELRRGGQIVSLAAVG